MANKNVRGTHPTDDYAHSLVDAERSNRARDNARFGLERIALERDILSHAEAAGSPKAIQERIRQEVDHVGDAATGHSPSSAPDDSFASSATGPRWHSHKR